MMMLRVAACSALAACTQASYLSSDFEDGLGGWKLSEATKEGAEADIAKYNGPWKVGPTGDGDNNGLIAPDENRHYAITASLSKPFEFDAAPLIVQYEVKYPEGATCGGSYIKLLSVPAEGAIDPALVDDKYPYTILFGPDKCGNEYNLRFIFRHKSPVTGEFREVHARKVADAYNLLFADKKTHLVKLVVKPDNTFQIMVDDKPVLSGRLGSEDEFDPALSPPKKIDDPEDKKPEDWVDEEQMDDPSDVKPDDWVDNKDMVDPEAKQPAEWDEDMDGDWEAPIIANPAFKGEWKAARIDNPEYKGVWSPKQLDNPEYFEDPDPFKMTPIGAAAFELWTTSPGFTFDNVLVTSAEADAEALAAEWKARREVQDKEDPKSAGVLETAGDGLWFFLTGFGFLDPYFDPPVQVVLMLLVLFVPIYLMCCSGAAEDDAAPAMAAPAAAKEGEEAAGAAEAEASDEAADEANAEAEPAGEEEEAEAEAEEEAEEPAGPAKRRTRSQTKK